MSNIVGMNQLEHINIRLLSGDKVTEEDVRIAINSYINNRVFIETKKSVNFKNEVGTSNKTRIDSEYNEIIIEYKRPDVKIDDRAINQLLGYMNSNTEKYKIGIITNFNEVQFYYTQDDNKIEKNEKHSGKLTDESLDFLIDIFLKRDSKIITAYNINDYLGVSQNVDILRLIYEKISNPKLGDRAQLLFSEWKKLMNLSDEYDKLDEVKKGIVKKFYTEIFGKEIKDTKQEYRAWFSIQTYYSLIVKLLLNKLMLNHFDTENISKSGTFKKYFEDIESNEFYLEKNITNLIDGDFYSWYLTEFEESDLKKIYDLVREVVQVDMSENDSGANLLLTFYENIFPFHVRHAMGEYYTPLHLADKVVSNSVKLHGGGKDIKIVDPTCGSGVFVTSALNKGFENVYGVDINPLAVLTSKINYIMIKGIPSKKSEIPIYLGDSTYIAPIEIVNDVSCFRYELLTSISEFEKIEFVFPVNSVSSQDFFLTLDKIEIAIKNLNMDHAIRAFKADEMFKYEELSTEYNLLLEALIYLERKNLNSIWLKIIGNYLKSFSIRNVDLVVGNPPWVRWSNLPDKYRELIKAKCRIDGIFSNDRNAGGVDLNICALIAFVSFRDRLNSSGVLGFLMPDSLLFNKSLEGFRSFDIDIENRKGFLTEVVRWNKSSEKPFDPVSIAFAEYYYTHKSNDGVVQVFDRKTSKSKVAYQLGSGNNNYSIMDYSDLEGIRSVMGTNSLKFRSGISLIKGKHYLLSFVDNICDKYAKFKVAGNGKIIKLEKEIVYPFIKAPDINDNTITDAIQYCIYPYKYGSKNPYSMNEIKIRFPEFHNYFYSPAVQKSLASSSLYNKRIQNVDGDVGIFRVGHYTYADFFLITRDNTKSMFAKVSRVNTHWGELKFPLFDGHVNYVSIDENGLPLTKSRMEELYDLFTNNNVKKYIEVSSDSRSISGRLYNNICIVNTKIN